MIEAMPVRVRRSEDGRRWYASGLTYSATGRGGSARDALNNLKEVLIEKYPDTSFDLRIRSVNVTFPSSLSEDEFLGLDVLKDKAELAG